MNTITSLLLMVINGSLEKTVYYDIAYHILSSYNCIQDMTLVSLAEKSHTSTTSITKFCKTLGFKNFTEFKFALLLRNKVRLEQLNFHMSHTSPDKIIQTLSLLATKDFDVRQFKITIEKVVELIHNSKHIIILGACFPEALSLHFQEDMLMMGKFVYSQTIIQNINIVDDQVDPLIIMISVTGRIYSYFKHSFQDVCDHFDNIVMMSASLDIPSYNVIKEFIEIPLCEDEEDGNVFILEILRYIKYIYYQKYIKGI